MKHSVTRFRIIPVLLAGMVVWFALTSFFSYFLSEDLKLREHLAQAVSQAAGAEPVAAEQTGTGASPSPEPSLPPLPPPKFLAEHRFEGGLILDLIGIAVAVAVAVVWLFPVQSWFRRQRKGLPQDQKQLELVRRRVVRSPLVIGFWLPLALMAYNLAWLAVQALLFMDQAAVTRELHLLPDDLLSAALSGLFMFLWQQHRVQYLYLRKLYSPAELQSKLPKGKAYSIRLSLILVVLLSSVLPLGVMARFIISGLTPIQNIESLDESQRTILFADYGNQNRQGGPGPAAAAASPDAPAALAPLDRADAGPALNGPGQIREFVNRIIRNPSEILYMDAFNTMRLLAGMLMGLLILLPYVVAIIRWTAVDLITQIDELRKAMGKVSQGELSAAVPVLSNNELGELALGFNGMLRGLEERNRIKGLFGQYLTSEVSEAILDGRVNLGGDHYDATIMFTDIRSFTSLSETMEPREVFEFLNEYLDRMIEVIVAEGGFIDKFIGDGILSVFGVPMRSENHALQAIATAQAMGRRLAELNQDRVARGKPAIAIGSGIHTGPVIAGNVGNARKAQYTVIGDTVNLASRLEGLNKDYGSTIVASGSTWDALPPELRAQLKATRLPSVEIRGKHEAMTLWRVD